MQAEVKGTTMPLLEMILESGESIVSTHGELSWMSANVADVPDDVDRGPEGSDERA